MADRNKPDKLENPERQVSDELAATTKPELNNRIRPPDGSRLDPVHVTGAISLRQADLVLTDDAALWAAIRNRTDAIRGGRYEEFIRQVLCLDYDADAAACLPEKSAGFRI